MPIYTWYRGIRFVKDFLVRYLNYIFLANRKGALLFSDGTKEITFSRTPIAIKRASWDARNLPAVLVGKAGGGLKYITFAKDILKGDNTIVSGGAQVDTFETVGGNFELTIGLSVRATQIDDRDNLVDIVGIYLAHPDAKDYFMNHYLLLPEAPTITGESDIKEPGIDHPIYATDLNLRVHTRWQEYSLETNYKLSDVIADITVEDIVAE